MRNEMKENMDWKDFKDISKYESEVDPMAIWDAIEPQVDLINDNKRKRKRIIFWLFFGLTIGGSGLYFINNSTPLLPGKVAENILDVEIESENSFANIKIQDKVEGINLIVNNGPKTIVQNANTIQVDNKLENANNERINDINVSEINITNSLKSIENEVNVFTENNNDNDLGVLPYSSRKSGSARVSSPEYNIKKVDVYSDDTPFSRPLRSLTHLNMLGMELLSENLDVSDTQEQNNSNKNDKNNESSLNSSLSSELNKIAFLNMFVHCDIDNQPIELNSFMETDKKIESLNNSEKKNFKFGILLRGGLSVDKRHLSVNDNMYKSSLGRKNDLETSIENYHLELLVDIKHKSHFGLLTGGSFTRLMERADYKYINIDTTYNVGIDKLVIDLHGDTIPVIGLMSNVRQTTTINKKYRLYDLVEIPVILTYSFGSKRWEYDLQAGVYFNYKMKVSDFSSEEYRASIVGNPVSIYKKQVGLSYYLGFSAKRHLTSHIDISIAPFLKYYPNSFIKNDYGLSQKYTLFGLKVGMSYNF